MKREGLVYKLIDEQKPITLKPLTMKDIERLEKIYLTLEKEYYKQREQFSKNFNKSYNESKNHNRNSIY